MRAPLGGDTQMTRSYSSMVAAAMVVIGASAMFAPAQAAFLASPPALVAGEASDGFVQVHRRRHHHHRHHFVRRHHQPYAIRPYAVYPYAYTYAYPYAYGP